MSYLPRWWSPLRYLMAAKVLHSGYVCLRLYRDANTFVKVCPQCQMQSNISQRKMNFLYPLFLKLNFLMCGVWTSWVNLWEHLGIDISWWELIMYGNGLRHSLVMEKEWLTSWRKISWLDLEHQEKSLGIGDLIFATGSFCRCLANIESNIGWECPIIPK